MTPYANFRNYIEKGTEIMNRQMKLNLKKSMHFKELIYDQVQTSSHEKLETLVKLSLNSNQ